MASGRPLKYTQEVLDELAISLKKWVAECRRLDEFRLLSDWCFENEFSPYNFKRYITKNDNFREAYEWAKSFQEHQVAKGAITKKFDPRFCQFFLGCQHGWRSKDDVEQQKRDLRNDFAKFIDHIKGEVNEDNDDESDEE